MTHIEPQGGPAAANAMPTAVSVAIIGIFAILLIGALYYASSFVLPIVLAVMVTLTLSPVVRQLSHAGIAAPISAVILVVGMALGLAAASALLSDPVSRMVEQAPEVARELRLRFASIGRPFEILNQAGKEVDAITDGVDGSSDTQKVTVARPGLLAWAAGTLADFGTTLVATLLLVPFLLASGDKLKAKLVQVVPGLSRKKQSLRVLRDIENEVSTYLLTVTAINCGLGVCVGAAMALLGMPNPPLWGLAAAILNFVPYAGALAGILLALAVATVTFTSLGLILAPPLAYLAIQIVEGAFITPTILGRRLELSTVAILVTLALTTWMWGIIGAVIGVPVLVMVKAFCDQFESLEPLRIFLSAEIVSNSDDPETASVPAAAAADALQALPPMTQAQTPGG